MRLSTNTQSGVWYASGLLKFGNLGNIHQLAELKGLCVNQFRPGLMSLPSKPIKTDLTESLINQLDARIISGINSLATGSDYEATNTGYRLKPGRILQAPFSFVDQFTDNADLFSSLVDTPTEDDIEIDLANPDQLGDEVRESNIVREFDKDLNIVSYVPLNKLVYICKYSRYDFSGQLLEYKHVQGDATDRVIQIPKVQGELHKIEFILLRYVS